MRELTAIELKNLLADLKDHKITYEEMITIFGENYPQELFKMLRRIRSNDNYWDDDLLKAIEESEIIDHEILKIKKQDQNFSQIKLEKLEREAIKNALRKSKGSQRKAAEILGISARALNYKIHFVHNLNSFIQTLTL